MEQTLHESCGIRLLYTCGSVDLEGKIQIGGFRYRLGRLLGEAARQALAQKPDYIVPVPNSGLYYAMGAAETTGVPYLQALVKRDDRQRTLSEPDQDVRTSMMEKNIALLPGLLEGKRVALVDETIFTGTTLKFVCDLLRKQGVAEIHLLLPTSACASSCPHDCLPQRDLLALRVPPEEMAEYFGVSSVTFLPYETLHTYSSNFQSVCLDCFRPAE